MTTPWWGTGLFTVIGAVVTMLGTLILGLLNRRSERRRLSRERKETSYPEVVSAANTLARAPVWPASAGDPMEGYAELDRLAQRVAFFCPRQVARTLTELLDAGHHLAEVITGIRADSRPIHDNGVDLRFAEPYDSAVDRLDTAITAFATAARADLEIADGYTLIRGRNPRPE